MVLSCIGCGNSSVDLGEGYLTSFDKYGTLQGKIMDATTNAAIGGKDLQMYLIQGTVDRKPDKLIRDADHPLVGEYAFAKIPVEIVNGDITFKIVAIKDGYQRFEANVGISTDIIEGDYITITDQVFNQIGNIYLYPLGSSAGDVTVYVYGPQGSPIPNATVLLRQNASNNNIISYTGDRLYATAGLNASLIGTTDDTGKAIFDGAQLTLGGRYSAVVEALPFENQELRTTTTGDFVVGTDSAIRVVNMSLANGAASLFAISASNSDTSTITPDGTLTITFNQPIALSTMDFTATISNGTLVSSTVTGQLSGDHMTLTLEPSISTPPTSNGAYIAYTYGGIIYLEDYQLQTTYHLFSGVNRVTTITTGQYVSGVVQLTSW